MSIIVTARFRRHLFWEAILKQVEIAMRYFPELEDVDVSLATCGTRGSDYAIATANWRTMEVSYNVAYRPSLVTTFHELAHIVQFQKEGVPAGEKAATIWGIARMPVRLVDSNWLPYISLAPRDRMPELCQHALQQRAAGNRHYIKWLDTWIESEKARDPAWPVLDDYQDAIKQPNYQQGTFGGWASADRKNL